MKMKFSEFDTNHKVSQGASDMPIHNLKPVDWASNISEDLHVYLTAENLQFSTLVSF